MQNRGGPGRKASPAPGGLLPESGSPVRQRGHQNGGIRRRAASSENVPPGCRAGPHPPARVSSACPGQAPRGRALRERRAGAGKTQEPGGRFFRLRAPLFPLSSLQRTGGLRPGGHVLCLPGSRTAPPAPAGSFPGCPSEEVRQMHPRSPSDFPRDLPGGARKAEKAGGGTAAPGFGFRLNWNIRITLHWKKMPYNS